MLRGLELCGRRLGVDIRVFKQAKLELHPQNAPHRRIDHLLRQPSRLDLGLERLAIKLGLGQLHIKPG